MAYLVSYDLINPGQDYTTLHEAIKSMGRWWHHLESTWIVTHPGPATTIRDRLRPHLDSNDKLLVVDMSGEAAWTGIPDKGSQWLISHLKK